MMSDFGAIPLPESTPPRSKAWLLIVLIILLVVILLWASQCRQAPSNDLPASNTIGNNIGNTIGNNTATNPPANTVTPPPVATSPLGCAANGYTATKLGGQIQLDATSMAKFLTATMQTGDIALQSIGALSCLESLTIFYAGVPKITSLNSLSTLTNLTDLLIDGTLVTDLTPLQKLPKLQKLMIAHSPITDLTDLSKLTKLTYLSLANDDQVIDFEPLKNLRNLGTLILTGTSITDASISPLINLANLRVLTMADTPLSAQVLANSNYLSDPNWQAKLVYPANTKTLLTQNSALKINWLPFQLN